MKQILMGAVAGAMLISSGVAFAQGAATPGTAAPAAAAANEADCKITEIDQALDNAIAAIKSSPAYGHAGGHYAKAEKDLAGVKKQLDEGCKAWMKGGEKTGKAGAKANNGKK